MATVSNNMTLFLLLISFPVLGQGNSFLSNQIDSLAEEDQKWRALLRKLENHETDTISRDAVINQIRITDSLNFIAIKNLFGKYGYPGEDKVGKESSHNFWIVVQHADNDPLFQDNVRKQMEVEVEKKNASAQDYAYLTDRIKVNFGELQIYGTQMTLNSTMSSYEIKPTADPDKLNDRRMKIGLPPIEDYIKIMNERYFGTLKKE